MRLHFIIFLLALPSLAQNNAAMLNSVNDRTVTGYTLSAADATRPTSFANASAVRAIPATAFHSMPTTGWLPAFDASAGNLQLSTPATSRGTNGVRWPDQYQGTDACAKIAAAIADLEGADGQIDARALTGAQSCASNPFAGLTSTQSLFVLFGNINLTITGSGAWVIPAGGSRTIYLQGMNSQRGSGAGLKPAGSIITNSTASSDTITITPNADGVTIAGFYFTGRSTGKHINLSAGPGIVSQVYIQGNQFNGMGYGVYGTTVRRGTIFECTIRDNIFNGQSATGIYLNSANNGSISQWAINDNRVQNFGGNGIDLINATGFKIDRNQITGGGGANSVGISSTFNNATTISNNDVESMTRTNAIGMQIQGGAFTLFGNNFYDNKTGLKCKCTNGTFIGNNNFNRGPSGAGFAVTLLAGSANVWVMQQSSDYPSGPIQDNSGVFSNTIVSNGILSIPSIGTRANCNVNGVSPAACGTAPAGTVVVPSLTTTYTINTTAVTSASRIIIEPITDATGLSGAPTCNPPPAPFIALQSARRAGVSFTFTLPSTMGTSCWTYLIVN